MELVVFLIDFLQPSFHLIEKLSIKTAYRFTILEILQPSLLQLPLFFHIL